MRFPSFVHAIYAFSNATFRSTPRTPFSSITRPSFALKASMPIPFVGALFSTAESRNMSYPVQKSDGEWKAQLNKGMSLPAPLMALQVVFIRVSKD